jgi:hypothetical protein
MDVPSIYNEAPIATSPNTALVTIASSREVAEAQSAIVVAKRFPRNEIDALDKIKNACQRPSLADSAMYSYARGGSDITGPSIRLAETMIRLWGNASYGIREIERRNGESVIEAFAMDLETNVRQVKVFTVRHERHTKKGKYTLEDPRDIYEAVANQGARRLRACILGIIPGDITEEAVSECEKTLKAKADTSPEALKKLVEAFTAFKVTKEQIEKRIQRRLDSITAAQLIQLRKIYNSLKDGMSGPSDWFEVAPIVTEEKANPTDSLKEKLRKGKDDKQAEEIQARFECVNGGFVTCEICDTCKDKADKNGDECPAYKANKQNPS